MGTKNYNLSNCYPINISCSSYILILERTSCICFPISYHHQTTLTTLKHVSRRNTSYQQLNSLTMKSVHSFISLLRSGEAHETKSFAYPFVISHNLCRSYSATYTEVISQSFITNIVINILHINV